MTQLLSQTLDRSRLLLDDPHQLGYWMAKWHASESALREAVGRVGSDPAAVKQFLGILVAPPPDSRRVRFNEVEGARMVERICIRHDLLGPDAARLFRGRKRA